MTVRPNRVSRAIGFPARPQTSYPTAAAFLRSPFHLLEACRPLHDRLHGFLNRPAFTGPAGGNRPLSSTSICWHPGPCCHPAATWSLRAFSAPRAGCFIESAQEPDWFDQPGWFAFLGFECYGAAPFVAFSTCSSPGRTFGTCQSDPKGFTACAGVTGRDAVGVGPARLQLDRRTYI